MPITFTPGLTMTPGFTVAASSVSNYSVQFDGSSQYLTTPYNAVFNLSTSDFTIEFWVYPTSFADNRHITGLAVGSNTTRSFYVVLSITTGIPVFYYYVNGTTAITLTGSSAPALNTWSHIAVIRASGTTKIYLNGVQVATGTAQSGAMYANGSSVFTIGREAGFNGSYVAGYVSNFRLVNGTAVYTGAFTPSTTGPLPATQSANTYGNPSTAISSGTSILTCQSSTIIDNSTNALTITNNGTAIVSSTNPFP